MAHYNSDFNPTMAVSILLQNIIHQVGTTNINIRIGMTPFSANVVIKDSRAEKSAEKFQEQKLVMRPFLHLFHYFELDGVAVKYNRY